MKTALCFHGDLRQFEVVFEDLIEKLKLKDYDIYIYTSKENYLKLENFSRIKINVNVEKLKRLHPQIKKISFSENDENYQAELIEKLKRIIEKLKKIDLNKVEDKNTVEHIKQTIDFDLENNKFNNLWHYPFFLRQLDQFLKMKYCSKMVEGNYDLFINTRCDNLFLNYFDLNKVIDEKSQIIWSEGVDYFFITKDKENFKKNYSFADYYGLNINSDMREWWRPEIQITRYIHREFSKIYNLNLSTNYLFQIKKDLVLKNLSSVDKKCTEIFGKKLLELSQPCIAHKSFRKNQQ